jgi:hypothetical protein
MKLKTETSRVVDGKKYMKHSIIIPNKLVVNLEWEKGDELSAKIIDGKLVIEKSKE